MIKQLILVFMYFILFPINLRHKKYVAELFQASKDRFKLVYYPDRYKTQNVCDEAFDDCLATLQFIPDRFVTSKMLEKLHDALFDDFSKVTSFANNMGILGIDLDKANLDDDNKFYEDDSETIIYIRLLAWRNEFERRNICVHET